MTEYEIVSMGLAVGLGVMFVFSFAANLLLAEVIKVEKRKSQKLQRLLNDVVETQVKAKQVQHRLKCDVLAAEAAMLKEARRYLKANRN